MVTAVQGDEVHVAKGAVLFRQGDPGHEMFVVSEGRIRLTIGTGGSEKEVALLGPGEFFGELSLLGDAPRSATAKALEDSRVLVIGRDVFKMMMQDDLEIVFGMLGIMGRRLSQTNVPIQELMQRMQRIRIVASCLKCFAGGNSQLPCTLHIDGLARELSIDTAETEAAVADLVRSGAGALRDGHWTIQGANEIKALVEALGRYAEARPG